MRAYNSDNTIEQFIAEHATPYDPSTDNYFREPVIHDVHTDKTEPLYQAHAYHTKISPGAILTQR